MRSIIRFKRKRQLRRLGRSICVLFDAQGNIYDVRRSS